MGGIVEGLVFLGKILLGTAGPGYAFATFVARTAVVIGLSVVSSKLFAPRIPNTRARLASRQTTVRSTTEYRSVVYGKAMVSGPIAYHNLEGGAGENAWYVIALAHGASESLESIWLDGHEIPAADVDWTPGTGGLDGSGTGEVSTTQWVNDVDGTDYYAVRAFWALGHRNQVAMAPLVDAFQNWNTEHRGRGVTYLAVSMRYIQETAEVWEEYGQPNDIKVVLKGRKVFDPRKYALNADPDFATIGKAVGAGLRWWSESTQTTGIDITAFSLVNGALRYSGSTNKTVVSERVPIVSGRRYRVRVTGKNIANSPLHSVGVYFYDSNGDVIGIGTSDASNWDSVSAVHWFHTATTFATSATGYFENFGGSETTTIPTGAVEMAIIWSANTSSIASAQAEISDFAVFWRTANDRHQFNGVDTWTWTDNPAVCLADYLTQYMNVPYARINWSDCVTTAEACDVEVSIPPSTTEKRFTCNGALSLGEAHKANIDKILSSADMMLRWTGGQWSMRPSVWQTPTLTIDGDWLTDEPISVNAMDGNADRFNTVRGFFIDPERLYEPVEFPQVTAATYVTRDNEEVLPYELELPMTNTHTMAQRIAYRLLERGNNQVMATTKMNSRALQLAIGDLVYVDWWPLGWTAGGNRILNSHDISTFEYDSGGVSLAQGALNPFGQATAWTVTIATEAGVRHQPSKHQPGGHTPDPHFPAGSGSADTELYIDLSAIGDEQNTYACWFKAGTMTTQFVTVAAVNVSDSPETTILEYDIDLTDGSYSKQETYTKNYIRVEPYPNGWHRVFFYVQEGLVNSDNVRLYLLRNATATLGDTFYVYGPQATTGYHYTMLYAETKGSAVDTTVKTMRVVEWKSLDDGRYDVTLREDDEGDYADPAESEYSVYTNGAISPPALTVPTPSNLTATSGIGTITWDWDDPASRLYDTIEIWQSLTSNKRWLAERVTQVAGSPWIQSTAMESKNVYTWIRARHSGGKVGPWHPDSSTGGVSGQPYPVAANVGLMDPHFDMSRNDEETSTLLGPFWTTDFSSGNCETISWNSFMWLNNSAGINNSNAVEVRLSDCNDASNYGYIQSIPRLRSSHGKFEIRVRYKASTGLSFTMNAMVVVWEDFSSETPLVYAQTGTLDTGASPAYVVADGTWRTLTWIIDTSGYDGSVFGARVSFTGSVQGWTAINKWVWIDSIQIVPVASSTTTGPVT